MRALVVSDLHFEFHRDAGRSMVASLPDADVCLCPGDISNARGIWEALLLLLGRYAHTVFVLGNHEFYGSNVAAVRGKLEKFQRHLSQMRTSQRLGHLHVLDNSTCEIYGQRFVGTTLWFRDAPGNVHLTGRLNDFYLIGDAHRTIREENERALRFLDETVASDDVVLTHHLPTEKSVHPKYEGSALNCFFLCDVEPLIQERQPRIWLHGHTHESADCTVGGTRILCNPFGYAAREENPAFDDSLIIEI